ncbi:YhcN/YlaJ family sporulation lipoprotein [Mesobacillus zeae]|uniref:Sporulation protein n=1 Tax=Mesobacillus zeae TaxID=1917180 RepID=A0A398BNF3_9BACI|nr:YhcN/YlaJ family sporulation lipoprotein [Mesobacillus zeae]RID88893.1 sporulation protein [Mesobacillus zeae]
MKKTVIGAALSGFLLAGCAGNNDTQDGRSGIFEESGNTLNVNEQRPDIYNHNEGKGMKNKSKDFGYVRHKRSGIMGDNQQDAYMEMDREQTADIISKLCLQTPNVDDASTLVTDKEVLIVYKTDSDSRNETADQVKKMAMSVVPRWFHVYVSDDQDLRKDVENFASLNTNSRDVDTLIDGVIKQMLKSPQGSKMSEGENENGESQGEMNDALDKDDLGEKSRSKQE